jgi:hypothetical protein
MLTHAVCSAQDEIAQAHAAMLQLCMRVQARPMPCVSLHVRR